MSNEGSKHKPNPNHTHLNHEGRYLVHVERGANIFRMSDVFFAIEGKIKSGPTLEYEGKGFSHVCNMTNRIGVWNARSIREAALFSEIGDIATRAWERSCNYYFEPPESAELAQQNDETVDLSPPLPLVVEVSHKKVRPRKDSTLQKVLGAERMVTTYKFSKAE